MPPSDGTRDQGSFLTWQLIRQNQVEGWVEASRLWRALPLTLAKTDLPAAGYCGASSPPWGLRWDDAFRPHVAVSGKARVCGKVRAIGVILRVGPLTGSAP